MVVLILPGTLQDIDAWFTANPLPGKIFEKRLRDMLEYHQVLTRTPKPETLDFSSSSLLLSNLELRDTQSL